MYTILVSFLLCSLPLILGACRDKTYIVQPKPNPKSKRILNKEERLKVHATTPSPERRKQHRQNLKKREERIAQNNKPLKELAYNELKDAKDALVEDKDLAGAIRYVERMLVVTTDLNELKELRLEIADLNFDFGDLEKAEELYNEYISFYPGSDLVEYAAYKGILSCFYQTLSSDRDQTKTTETVKLAETFLKQPSYRNYNADVRMIQHQCFNKNFESELNVVNFYLEQDKIKSAEQRLAYLKEKYQTDDLPINIQLISLELQVAQKQNNTELCNQKQQQLIALNEQLNTQYLHKELDLQSKISLDLLRNNDKISLPTALMPAKKTNYVNRF